MFQYFLHIYIYIIHASVLDSRPKGRRFEPHRSHCVVSLSKNINPSLVLVQPRKTRPLITERLLMGRKESNQTNKQIHASRQERALEPWFPNLSFRTYVMRTQKNHLNEPVPSSTQIIGNLFIVGGPVSVTDLFQWPFENELPFSNAMFHTTEHNLDVIYRHLTSYRTENQ